MVDSRRPGVPEGRYASLIQDSSDDLLVAVEAIVARERAKYRLLSCVVLSEAVIFVCRHQLVTAFGSVTWIIAATGFFLGFLLLGFRYKADQPCNRELFQLAAHGLEQADVQSIPAAAFILCHASPGCARRVFARIAGPLDSFPREAYWSLSTVDRHWLRRLLRVAIRPPMSEEGENCASALYRLWKDVRDLDAIPVVTASLNCLPAVDGTGPLRRSASTCLAALESTIAAEVVKITALRPLSGDHGGGSPTLLHIITDAPAPLKAPH